MPTDRLIRSVSSLLRWRDYRKAIPQSPPALREWPCSAPPTRSISRRHVLRDDESLRANVRAGPRLPPSTLSLKSRAVRSRLNRQAESARHSFEKNGSDRVPQSNLP